MALAPKAAMELILLLDHQPLSRLLEEEAAGLTAAALVMMAALAVAVAQIMVVVARVIPPLQLRRKDFLVERQQVVFG
jgi:hypothetical protein